MASNLKQEKKQRRWWLIGLGLVVVGSMLALTLRPQSVSADFANVERGAMRVTLDEEGETRVRNRYLVSAPVAGRVLRIELEPGDTVIAGDTVLATFQPATPQLLDSRTQAESRARVRATEAALGRARAERERAAAEREFTAVEVERMRRLAADEIVSRERLDTAELRVATADKAHSAADFAVRTASHELEMARAALHSTGEEGEPITITSPIDGVVLRRLQESEAVVAAGSPLLEVADPSRLEIVADYLSTDAVRINAGDLVIVDHWGGDRQLHGRVRRVEPSGYTKISALGVEEQRVNVVIDFDDPAAAWKALGDGFRVEVNVVVWQGDDVLKAPTSSLFRHRSADGANGEDEWAVFRVTDDLARLTPVEIGHRNGLQAEIASGLEAGDVVIVHPGEGLENGVSVEAREP